MLKAGLIFLAMGLIILVYWLIFSRHLETTDDAYVNGHQVRITPRTNGTILEILVNNTEDVLAGDLLARLDPTDAQLALAEARENLANAVRQVASLNAQRLKLIAQIEARRNELILAEGEYQRRLRLKPGTSVTIEEVERYRSQTDVARANLAAAKAELSASELVLGGGPLENHPQIKGAALKLKEAWLALERCQIKSPVSGRIARRTAQVGSQVTAGSPLMMVTPLDDIWVDANFKESQLDVIKTGQKVRIFADLYNGKVVHEGVIVGRSAGTGSVFSLLPPENATGNWIKVVQRVPVRVAIHKENIAKDPLLLGLSCRVEVLLNEPLSDPPATGPLDRAAAVEADFTAIDKEIETSIKANLSLDSVEPHEPPKEPS
jgi:membrane fusion protein (multidrug efflux system)